MYAHTRGNIRGKINKSSLFDVSLNTHQFKIMKYLILSFDQYTRTIDQVCVPQTVAKRRQAPPPPPPFHPLLTSPLLLLSLQARTVSLSLSCLSPFLLTRTLKDRIERGIKEKFQIRSHPPRS